MYKLDGFPYCYKEANIAHSILTKAWRVVESAGSGLSEEFNLLELPGLSQLKQRQYNLMVKLNGLFLFFTVNLLLLAIGLMEYRRSGQVLSSFLITANCNNCGLSCVVQHSTTCYSPSGPCLAQQEWLFKAFLVKVWMLRINLYQYCLFLIICKPIWSLINDKL